MRKLTVIEKFGGGFLVMVGLFLIYGLAWSFLTDAGRTARQEDRRKSEEIAAARERAKEREERGAAESESLEEDLMSAWARCQGFAEGRLVSPASAEWPWDNRPYTSHLGAGRFRVQTHVDSQNRFGAMLRKPVDCIVQKTGSNKWRLESLDME